MMWFLFALGGALGSAIYYFLIKKFLGRIDKYMLASGAFLSASLLLLLVTGVRGVPPLGDDLAPAVLASGVVNVAAAVLYYRAFELTDLSLALPMISFTPVFLIGTSTIVLQETPGIYGVVGIFLVVAGTYILHMTAHHRGFGAPFRAMLRDKGVLYMLVVAFLFSISGNYDKLVVINSDPVFGQALKWLFVGSAFLGISLVRGDDWSIVGRNHIPRFLAAGSVLAIGNILINVAFTLQIVPYVISLKRTSILFTVILGGTLLREERTIQRALGAAIMVAGAVLIILYG